MKPIMTPTAAGSGQLVSSSRKLQGPVGGLWAGIPGPSPCNVLPPIIAPIFTISGVSSRDQSIKLLMSWGGEHLSTVEGPEWPR